MSMSLQEACNILHVDEGTNDDLIMSLVSALPDYIEVTTGMSYQYQPGEPLCQVVSGLLLTQWYYADHADDQALTRSINALLKAISLRATAFREDRCPKGTITIKT